MDNANKALKAQVLQWLEIVKDDLTTSKILYLANRYRNSYYFFQQAVEKANKALALYAGFTEKELKEISHNQFKIFRKQINEQANGVEQLVTALEQFPLLSDQTIFKQFDFKEHHKSLMESVSFIDSLKNIDLIHIPIGDIDHLLNLIDETASVDLDLPAHTDPVYRQMLFELSDLMGKIEIKEGETTKAEFDALINDESNNAVLIKLIRYEQRIMKLLVSVEVTFGIMAYFTTRHNDTTRYVKDGISPMKIYTKKLPLVLRQEELMQYFEVALTDFYKIINMKPFTL